MPIRVTCPRCRSSYNVPDDLGGKKVSCLNCQNVYRVSVAEPLKEERTLFMLPGEPPARHGAVNTPERPRHGIPYQPPPMPIPQRKPGVADRPSNAGRPSHLVEKKKGVPLPWIVGGAAAAFLFFVVVGGAGAWLFLSRNPGQGGDQSGKAIPALELGRNNQAVQEVAVGNPVDNGRGEVDAQARIDGNDGRLPDGIPVKNLDRLKAATVFIKVDSAAAGVSGSGFVMKVEGNTGYIVTNHHVVNPKVEATVPAAPLFRPPGIGGPRFPTRPSVKGSQPGAMVPLKNAATTLVFWSGTKKERSAPAVVIASDEKRDLAVLKVVDFENLPRPIDFSQPPTLVETMPVFVFGFPFGKALSTNNGNPAITVGKGSVSSIRLDDRGNLAVVQIDGALNPGNSGGPVVDAEGRLVGVAVATIKGTGIGLAIPATELTRMLEGKPPPNDSFLNK